MDRTRHCHGNHIFLKTLKILVQITPLLFNEFYSYSLTLSKTVTLRTGLSFGRIMLRLAVLLLLGCTVLLAISIDHVRRVRLPVECVAVKLF